MRISRLYRIAAGLVWLTSVFAPAHADDAVTRLLRAARSQVGQTLRYDAGYARIAYPMGDVPIERGVCTDVLIRAYRKLGIDLQQRVHEDMRANWSVYPKTWGLRRPDTNIDHRRVPNLAVFLRRHGETLPVSQQDPAGYAAGDIVTWRLPGNLPHIGIVSSRRVQGRPLVLHNIGAGTVEEDALLAYPVTGHYRYLPDDAPRAASPSR